MNAGQDQHEPSEAPDPRAPASQAQVAALTLRVAALESQLASLTRAAQPVSAPFRSASPEPPPAGSLPTISTSPAAPPPLPITIAPAPPARQSLEDRLGSQVFNFIGVAALIVGASWALKLAIEHGLIGPVARVILGLAIGAGLILWSERFRRKGFAAFSYSLKAVGSGILYLSLWAAFQIYHLLPAPAALAAMVLVTAWNAFMAWSQDAELLAAYALAGGLATPILLSTGGNHERFLFLYLAAIAAAAVLLLRSKPWPRLLPPAFLATAFYFLAWYSEFFHRPPPLPPRYFYPRMTLAWDAESTETTLFVLLFAAIFALPSLRGWVEALTTSEPVPHPLTASPSMSGAIPESTPTAPHSSTALPSMSGSPFEGVILSVLLPLGNAAFLSLALRFILQDSGLHTSVAWAMLALSALYLALTRLQATATARAIHLAIAVIFLTVAIPLKASGHTLTTAWLLEGLVLFWASTRLDAPAQAETKAPIRVLHLLSAAGYLLGLLSLAIHWSWFNFIPADTFFNANLGSALVAIASLAGLAWLASRPTPSLTPLTLSLTGIDLVAFLLLLREIFLPQLILGSLGMPRRYHAYPAGFHVSNVLSTAFLDALVALAVLATASWFAHRLAISHLSGDTTRLRIFAASSLVAFNFFAILTGVREITALWSGTAGLDSGVQRSLAISAFLMLYGAILLAAGFWRRSAFVRWQALILLIFTILKVFLSDVSGLSQGYRVASFLSLGALLMAVSFAYQKDWLGLKAAAPLPAQAPIQQERA